MMIQTNGLKIAFDDTGVNGKPVLVLLHAFPLSREMWKSQREALKIAARVITPDLRGFGETDGFEGSCSVEVMADDVIAMLDALNIKERVVVGGLSMGGYVALAFARKYEDRLRGLLLADTKAEPDDDTAKANRNKLIEFAKGAKPADVLQQMLPKMVSEETRERWPAVITEIERIASQQNIPGIVGALQAIRDRPDSVPGLVRIVHPTLVIVGEEDAITPPSAAQVLVEAIGGAKLEKIAGAGHLSNMEKPTEFNQAVQSWMTQFG